jgi:hypothetical protein
MQIHMVLEQTCKAAFIVSKEIITVRRTVFKYLKKCDIL